jgi:hypothetical protein
MIVDPMLLEGGYNLLSEQFNAKYKDEIAELFSIITNEGTVSKAQERDDYEKRVQVFTDYRTYLFFDLEVINREGESQRLSKTLREKSGVFRNLRFPRLHVTDHKFAPKAPHACRGGLDFSHACSTLIH